MSSRSRRILVLYAYPASRSGMRSAIRRHLEALESAESGDRFLYYNALRGAGSWLRRIRPDAVVLHTTFLGMRWSPGFRRWRSGVDWVADLGVPKIALPQDEYDHAWVLDRWLSEWRVDAVYSNFGTEARKVLYPTLGAHAEFRECLTGYIDERDASEIAPRLLPQGQRPVDLVYRATRLPYWFGSLGQLKHRIGQEARRVATALGLSSDISTDPKDAVVGSRWLRFLAAGRATIGCESGSSVLDPDGTVRARIESLLQVDPGATFEQVGGAMPPGWEGHRFAALSPRHLEAVVTRTAQVLVEGHYSGVLEAGRHYVPVRADLSDLNEALGQVRDLGRAASVADAAYREVFGSGRFTYRMFAADVLRSIEGRAQAPAHREGLASRAGWAAARVSGAGAAAMAVAGDRIRRNPIIGPMASRVVKASRRSRSSC